MSKNTRKTRREKCKKSDLYKEDTKIFVMEDNKIISIK